jgi:hypothetical protein
MNRSSAVFAAAFHLFLAGVLTNAQENPVPAVAPPPPAAENAAVAEARVPDTMESAAPAKPEDLRRWSDWVLHGLPGPDTPRAHDDANVRIPLWSSRLKLDATATGATFSLQFESFDKGWLALPGSPGRWPEQVRLESGPVPVVEREDRPAIRVEKGSDTVSGTFTWPELPQQIKLPPPVGLLALTINGQAQSAPSWDADGTLWLQRQATNEPVDQDSLQIKIHSLLEDGIPLWFESRLELVVAGKSREETLGTVLPTGWQLAAIESPLPVAIDESGLLKSQIRAGRWTMTLRAFRTDSPDSIGFAEGASPAVADQAIASEANPSSVRRRSPGCPRSTWPRPRCPRNGVRFRSIDGRPTRPFRSSSGSAGPANAAPPRSRSNVPSGSTTMARPLPSRTGSPDRSARSAASTRPMGIC